MSADIDPWAQSQAERLANHVHRPADWLVVTEALAPHPHRDEGLAVFVARGGSPTVARRLASRRAEQEQAA